MSHIRSREHTDNTHFQAAPAPWQREKEQPCFTNGKKKIVWFPQLPNFWKLTCFVGCWVWFFLSQVKTQRLWDRILILIRVVSFLSISFVLPWSERHSQSLLLFSVLPGWQANSCGVACLLGPREPCCVGEGGQRWGLGRESQREWR